MVYKPIRCYAGNAQPHERFWKAMDEVESQTGMPTIDLEGVISEISWFEDDITPQMFRDDLSKVGKGGPIMIRVNSGGGDVVAASVIRSILAEYPGHKTMKITGLAASAAVAIVLAGDKILIQDTAFMMIHDPSLEIFMASLDLGTMKSLVSYLETVKQSIQDTYAAKTGISTSRIEKMMTDSTWLSANDAVKFGFADEVISAGRDAAGNTGLAGVTAQNQALLKNYVNVPAVLLNCIDEPVQENVAEQLSEEEQRLSDEVNLNL